MSCFVVTKECLDRAVWAMVFDPNSYPHWSYRWDMCENGVDEDGNFTRPSQADNLGREMYELNLRAYHKRYPKEIREDHPQDLQHTYRFDWNRAKTPEDALKALQCVIYQCSEGKELEEHAIYQMMVKAQTMLAMRIIERTPAYESACWG